jgi:mercuric ion binding protein
MKKLLLVVFLSIVIPGLATAEEIKITVKGMVCSFCAQGIKKQFSSIPAVEKVEPNLDQKLVVVTTKENANLPDDKIKEVIKDAGYDVVNIERK